MQTRSNSSTTILLILVIIFTFPIWIGLAGGLFGIFAGIIGGLFGVIAGVFGAVFGAIGAIFGSLFKWHWGPDFHFFLWGGKAVFIAIIFLLVIVIARPGKSR
jgi:hypothetical protein